MSQNSNLKPIPTRFSLDSPHITGKVLNDHRRETDPKVYVEKYIKEKKCRSDLRKFEEYRECSCVYDDGNLTSNFACTRIGQTHIVCGATSSVVKPLTNAPDKGLLEINFQFLGHSGNEISDLEKNSIIDLAKESMKKILFHSNWIDLEQLCLISKKYVHKILLEVLIFTFDGAIIETALLGIICALQRLKLQKYDVDEELGIITKIENEHVSLNVSENIPTSSTFVLICGQILVDPTWCEELVCDSILRIALDPNSEVSDSIFLMEMVGKGAFTNEQIRYCFNETKNRGKYFINILKNSNSSSNVLTFEKMS